MNVLLRKLKIFNFGPFAYPVDIDFEKTVTVLTGANDTGKSSVLRLLSYIGERRPLQEDDVNINRLLASDAASSWDEDAGVYCIATYEFLSNYKLYLPSPSRKIGPGVEIDLKVQLAPKIFEHRVKEVRRAGNKVEVSNRSLQRLPLTLFVTAMEKVGSIIDFSRPTDVEKLLLNLAFGKKPVERLSRMNEANFDLALQKGEERLDKLAKQILPPSMQMKFSFRKLGDSPIKLSFRVRDRVGDLTPFHLRGAGVQRLIGLLIYILAAKEQHPGESLLLLIDEPENSLHADAQHLLRYFLEQLAESETFQVVYATHSPAMLNPLRPQSIRLFRRERWKDVATSVVDNKPIHDNFKSVRSGLGILPSDSLLYAPVTIIVEGITERQSLPALLLRLEEESKPGFEGVGHLLSLAYFLDGHGSSFELWCRLAEDQGVMPIIFVDNDKERELQQQKVHEKHPSVPIVLVGKREFEDIVPRKVYLEALAEIMENSDLTEEAFDKWLREADDRVQNMAFTKQVERWLQDIGVEENYYKDEVMLRAIEKVDFNELELQPFRILVNHMRERLSSVHLSTP